MDSKWQKGPPTDAGLYVCEWMNMGGYAVFRVVNRDGVLFARDTETESGQRETRLDKWAVLQCLRIPCPTRQMIGQVFNRDISEKDIQRPDPCCDREATPLESDSAAENVVA
jgi:hypothetical protein